jgi:hypothetical protein
MPKLIVTISGLPESDAYTAIATTNEVNADAVWAVLKQAAYGAMLAAGYHPDNIAEIEEDQRKVRQDNSLEDM